MMRRALWAGCALLLACEGDGTVVRPDGSSSLPPTSDGAVISDTGTNTGMDAVTPPPPPPSDGGSLPACGTRARTDDPSGDYVLLGNASGGRFTFVVDLRLRAVGVLARGPVDVTLTGAFSDMVQTVMVVGPSAATAVVRGVEARIEQRDVSNRAVMEVAGESATM